MAAVVLQSPSWDAAKLLSGAAKVLKDLIKARNAFHEKVAKKDAILGIGETYFDDENKPTKLLGGATTE